MKIPRAAVQQQSPAGKEPSSTPVFARLLWSVQLALRAPWQGGLPFKSAAAIERAQERHVRNAVSHAYRYVPYYRETMRRLGLGPDDLQTAADLSRLPVLDRAELQRDPEYFLSTARPRADYLRLRTSGTSGQPMTVFRDAHMLFKEAAHGERRRAVIMKLAGKRIRYRAVRIATPTSVSVSAARAFERQSFIPFGIRVVYHHLSLYEHPARNVELINKLNPDEIFSYGSYIEALFRYVEESGVDFHVPRVVTYGADALSASTRRRLTERFGLQVLSIYGAIEAPSIGFECEEHLGHHLNVDLYPVRILDANEAEVADGESGEVIVSNLVSRGTVLLNYRLGDIASKRPGPCPCGRSLPLLSFVEGRIDDWLQGPSGELIHPQAAVKLVAPEEEIWQAQIIQHGPSRFEVLVVPAAGCDRDGLRARLRHNFADRFGDGTTDVAFVESLPRTDGGKVRAVISRRRSEMSP